MSSSGEFIPPIAATGVLGGVGLAAQRCVLGDQTLVTTASDHVALRTPSRPDFVRGNGLHLFSSPADLAGWLDRCDATVGALAGYRGARVSWSQAPSPGVSVPDGCVLSVRAVLDLRSLHGSRIDPTVQVESATSDVQLAGASAQYLHSGWPGDQSMWAWWSSQQAGVVRAGRGSILVARRFGLPVGRVSAFHDRAGLATVIDLVVHPLYRGGGIGRTLVQTAVRDLVAAVPETTVVASVDDGVKLPGWLSTCPELDRVVVATRTGSI